MPTHHPALRRAIASTEPLEPRTLLSQINFTVSNTNDSGTGSLRQAITDANGVAAGDLAAITFDLPAGLNTINLLSGLPFITAEVNIAGPVDSKGNPLLELNGASAGQFSDGLFLDRDTPGNTIASTISGLVINRFGAAGIDVHQGAAAIFDCRIGTNSDGSGAQPNGQQGILLEGAGSTIGQGANGNIGAVVLSGNEGDGLDITGSDNTIRHCLIGTNASGTKAVANHGWGIEDSGTNNEIGTREAHGNLVVSGNALGGIHVTGNGETIQHSDIGTDITGSKAIPNRQVGVEVDDGQYDTIGTFFTNGPNVISGNKFAGVTLVNSTEAYVDSNKIGTNAAGTAALGNTEAGVFVTGTRNVVQSNVISANGQDGVVVEEGALVSNDNALENNLIGTDVTGKKPIPNTGDGVLIEDATNTSVYENTIAFNAKNGDDGFGVDLLGGTTTGNDITQNSIFSNARLGINLGDNGGKVLKNDNLDPDVGPNNLQNYPVLTSAKQSGTDVTVKGTLNSLPNTTFHIEFFTSAAADPSGFGQGQTYINVIKVTTDASGNATFHLIFAAPAAGSVITTTATDPFGNTSEFSNAIKMT
jgi:hypothetical protein